MHHIKRLEQVNGIYPALMLLTAPVLSQLYSEQERVQEILVWFFTA